MGVLAPPGEMLRACFRHTTGMLSLLISAARTGKITFSEFLEELDELSLKGKKFGRSATGEPWRITWAFASRSSW